MPAQARVRRDDRRGVSPGPEATGAQEQERPAGRRAARALDATLQDEALLAQEGALGDAGGSAAREVGERARSNRGFGGLRRGERALPECAGKGSPALGTTPGQAR